MPDFQTRQREAHLPDQFLAVRYGAGVAVVFPNYRPENYRFTATGRELHQDVLRPGGPSGPNVGGNFCLVGAKNH